MSISYKIGLLFFFTLIKVHSQNSINNSTAKDSTITISVFSESHFHLNNDSLANLLKVTQGFDKKQSIINQLIEGHTEKGNADSTIYYGTYLFNLGKEQKSGQKKDSLLSASAHIIAKASREKGLYGDAIKWHLIGLENSENLSNKNLFYNHKLGMGVISFFKQDYDEAIVIYNECIKNSESDDIRNQAYNYLGNLYFQKGAYKKARENYLKVNEYAISTKNIRNELISALGLGEVSERLEEYQAALDYYTKVIDKSLVNNFYDLNTDAQNKLGVLYTRIGQYDAANITLSSAYINAVTWENLAYQETTLKNMINLKLAEEDFQQAYALMTRFKNISDRIKDNQNKKEVKELEIQYNTLQKEKEIEKQRTLKKYLSIGFLIVLVPVIGLLYMYYKKHQAQNELNKIQEETNKKKIRNLLKEQELKLIRASVVGEKKERKRIARELHDGIGGNLAGIKMQLSNKKEKDEDYKKIAKQIDETYEQVRDISHNLMPKKFDENIFTSLIKDYISGLDNSSNKKFTFSSNTEEDVNKVNENIKVEFYNIIQELLTNAYKHAKADQIDINLNKFDNSVKLLYEDDGVGFDTLKTKKGIGLNNIKSRVESLSGTFNIDSFPGRGTVIDIDIPL